MATFITGLEASDDPELQKLFDAIDEYCNSSDANDCSAIVPQSSSPVSNGDPARERVNNTLDLFRTICKDLLRGEETRRVDCKAAAVIRRRPDFVNIEKCVGPVPGVYVGDEFPYRMEISLVGLHKPPEAGIDYMIKDGRETCVSIVAIAFGEYVNYMHSPDILIYCGQGGNVGRGRKEPEDQRMEKGNLALNNNIVSRHPVRVIRGKRETNKNVPVHIYDGLYTVVRCRDEKAVHGKLVFKFELRRIPGQPQLSIEQWKKLGIVGG